MILVTGGLGFTGSHARALPGLPRWHSPCAPAWGAAWQNRRKDCDERVHRHPHPERPA
jgi:hypothetical protein